MEVLQWRQNLSAHLRNIIMGNIKTINELWWNIVLYQYTH